MRRLLPAYLMLVSMSGCSSQPKLSEAEAAFLERTHGFVAEGSYPIVQELAGSDGFLLEFTAGNAWNSDKEAPYVGVKSVTGKWMPCYAGESGSKLEYHEALFSLRPSTGQAIQLYIIASPEDSIAEIVVDRDGVLTPLFQRGDSIAPAKSDHLRVRPEEEVKGKVLDDTTEKGSGGPYFHSK